MNEQLLKKSGAKVLSIIIHSIKRTLSRVPKLTSYIFLYIEPLLSGKLERTRTLKYIVFR